MASEQSSQSTFLDVTPRFVVHDMEQALAFYKQLCFQASLYYEYFAILKRDEVYLHLHFFPEPESPRGHAVCWITVTNIEVLYQQYLPTNAVCAPLEAKSWGFKEFCVRDPSGNLILFAEHLPEADASSEKRTDPTAGTAQD